MEVMLHPMSLEEKTLLVRLMELYNYEFTAYDGADINEFGYYGYEHIDDYWNEEGRFPYLIRVDGKIAGFALVCPYCRYLEEEGAHSVGEFFVMMKYRRMGVGRKVAAELFRRHTGLWEVCYLKNNLCAGSFWKKVVSEYTQNRFELCGKDDAETSGFIFRS